MHLASLLATSWLIPATLAALPSPLICEDPIDGSHFGYDSDSIPCFIGCDGMVFHPTGYDSPYDINATMIPYCMLDCVRKDATPTQSARAPECSKTCANSGHFYNPEVMGWCMFWCVDGYKDVVASTTCVPEIGYATKAEVWNGETITARVFTKPSAWKHWYKTETALSHNDMGRVGMEGVGTAPSEEGTTATSTTTQQAVMSTTIRTTQGGLPAMTRSSSTNTGPTVSRNKFSTVTSAPSVTLFGAHEQTTSPPSTTTTNAGAALYPGPVALVSFACFLIILR